VGKGQGSEGKEQSWDKKNRQYKKGEAMKATFDHSALEERKLAMPQSEE